MECQACAIDGIPEALSLLTKTYTVAVMPQSKAGACQNSQNPSAQRYKTTDTKELNPFEYKLARELSKKKPKKQVVQALKAVIKEYRKVFSIAQSQSLAYHKFAKIAAIANDDSAARLANSAALDYKNIVLACRSLAPTLKDLASNRRAASTDSLLSLAELARNHEKLVAAVKALLPLLQQICLGCSRTSNDDNLSRYGQVFVSIDAMNSLGLIASGADPTADLNDCSDPTTSYNGDSDINDKEDSDAVYAALDSNHVDDLRDSSSNLQVSQTAHDYLLSHTALDVHSQDPESSSKLPAHIEDLLRKYLSDFNHLDTFEKFLCFSQWSGQSFSEFGTMKWIPEELKRPQSKQFVTQRWNKLLEKFPVAAALRKGKVCYSESSDLARHYNCEALEQLELQL